MKVSVERRVKQEIMNTDVYVNVISDEFSREEVDVDVTRSVCMMREFEDRFSRFKKEGELVAFNASHGEIQVSQDLLEMLVLAKKYYVSTEGLFDISILPLLQSEGYVESRSNDSIAGSKIKGTGKRMGLDALVIDENRGVITKPRDLQCDLGGIGKGFIVDRVVSFLSEKYADHLVDAGGDLYASGRDSDNDYEWWAIQVEGSGSKNDDIMLVVHNRGVATSGVGRRSWKQDGKQKNHIIDVRTGKSLENSLLSVTVIAKSVVEADIWAKTLLIMGQKRAMRYAEQYHIPALFIDNDAVVTLSSEIKSYIWNNEA